MRRLFLLLILGAAAGAAQPPAPVQTGGTGLIDAVTDVQNVSLVTYSLAQIADSTTSWKFTVGGKQYDVSPAQRTAFAGASIFGAIAVSHYFPKAKPYVAAALVVGSAILAGRAYANTLTHGAAQSPVLPLQPVSPAFRLRLR